MVSESAIPDSELGRWKVSSRWITEAASESEW